MKTLLEGYVRLDGIIRHDQHLDEGVVEEFEMFINKNEICVTHMQDYKIIWTEEILPRREGQSKSGKTNRLNPTSLNPYGVTIQTVKLVSLKVL